MLTKNTTLKDARKLIGRSFYDRQVEEFQATHPIMITNIGNHPVIELIYNKEVWMNKYYLEIFENLQKNKFFSNFSNLLIIKLLI